jgi:hypothetical protein
VHFRSNRLQNPLCERPAVDGPQTAGFRLALLGFAWLCLALLGFAWLCLALLGFAWFRLVSLNDTPPVYLGD